MEQYYIIVGVLFILAISDLIVGVSNDAVNFLNSAIGSKAAPFKIILAIAAAGVLVGAVFSEGMMEVARKGIFNPGEFAFNEIMIIFLAVMLTDVILLDFFNTLGLPTSTTVSIVFELLGSAVAVALFKVIKAGEDIATVSGFINIASSVKIIVGIFLSVVVAFTVGLIIQWLVRLMYSFNVKKTYKYWTGIWGGFAITAILFFLLIKGSKGSTIVPDNLKDFINDRTGLIMLFSFVGWSLILQVLSLIKRFNILKMVVLIGTFALAMAFAGNDLVNFIGVPVAGFKSFQIALESGAATGSMQLLGAEKVETPIYFLIAAGMVMVMTLALSKKAKSVTATTLDLSRQGEGSERFASSSFARFLVRRAVETGTFFSKVTPAPVSRLINSRFDAEKDELSRESGLSFDLVRASVNLVVASILIAIGTSLKLPLSTTYVTFMVAMGTSLADGAWGRESAVYRITGVLTVIGGWFFTAFSAFMASFLVATLIFFGKLPAILVLIALAAYLLIRTHAFHKKRMVKKEELDSQIFTSTNQVLDACENEIESTLAKTSKIFYNTFVSFFGEKHKEMKGLRKDAKKLSRKIKELREDIPDKLRRFEESELESGHYYVQVLAYMKEMSNSLLHVVLPAFTHLDNNHPTDKEQAEEVLKFNKEARAFFEFGTDILKMRSFEKIDDLTLRRDELMAKVNDILRKRIKILKKTQKGAKISVTYMEMLSESKNLFLNVVQLVKATATLHETMDKSRVDIDLNLMD